METTFVVNKEALQVVMSRVFDAPVEKVYKACTDPKIIPEWWGPRNLTTTVETMDFRVGGKWRFIQKDPQDNEYAFRGEYKEIVPNKLVSNTFEFEPMAGHILVETATYEDLGGKTKLTAVSQYANIGDLEGMVASGMESGAREGWEQLAEYVTAH